MWGESIGHRSIPLRKGHQCRALMVFLMLHCTSCFNKLSSYRWYGTPLRSCHVTVILKCPVNNSQRNLCPSLLQHLLEDGDDTANSMETADFCPNLILDEIQRVLMNDNTIIVRKGFDAERATSHDLNKNDPVLHRISAHREDKSSNWCRMGE